MTNTPVSRKAGRSFDARTFGDLREIGTSLPGEIDVLGVPRLTPSGEGEKLFPIYLGRPAVRRRLRSVRAACGRARTLTSATPASGLRPQQRHQIGGLSTGATPDCVGVPDYSNCVQMTAFICRCWGLCPRRAPRSKPAVSGLYLATFVTAETATYLAVVALVMNRSPVRFW